MYVDAYMNSYRHTKWFIDTDPFCHNLMTFLNHRGINYQSCQHRTSAVPGICHTPCGFRAAPRICKGKSRLSSCHLLAPGYVKLNGRI